MQLCTDIPSSSGSASLLLLELTPEFLYKLIQVVSQSIFKSCNISCQAGRVCTGQHTDLHFLPSLFFFAKK